MSCHHHGSEGNCQEGEPHHHYHEDGSICACSHHEHHHHHSHKYSNDLLALADEAWMEVLKEKIKDQIRATSSRHLDQMAKLVTDVNHFRWKHKMEEKSNEEEFENKLRELLHQKQRE